jgi:hypothetical protein
VNELIRPEINVALGGRNFNADSVAAFRQRGVNGIYLVINDSKLGFQAGFDARIFLAVFNVNDRNEYIAVLEKNVGFIQARLHVFHSL